MIYSIFNKNISATFSSLGAELQSFAKIETGRNYLWNANSEFWAKHSPVLFPIVGTLKNNFFVYENQKYEMPRHGFARDCNFVVVQHRDQEIIFSLQSNEQTLSKYPFHFELQIQYTLVGFELKVRYSVINHDVKPIPFSIGGHPAFALPENFEKYSLLFEHQEKLKSYSLTNDLLSENYDEIAVTNKLLPLSYSLFENDALILKELKSKVITILECGKPIISMSYSDFLNFGIWTKPNAPFICLEPWLGYSDIKNHNHQILEKEGIQIVEEKSTFECSYSIIIH